MGEALHAIAEPWSDPIVRHALFEVALLSIPAGVVGCWIVFYNLSYSAESFAHALFPGLVAASLLGIPLLVGGVFGLALAAVAIALAGRTQGIGSDTAVGVVVTTLFGAGVVLALAQETPPGLQTLLFGDILGVSNLDLALALGLAALVIVAIRLLFGQLLTVAFDRANARALGARPLLVDTALVLLVALTILVAVQGLGNLLVVALLIGPAATAQLVARRMLVVMVLASGLALFAGAGGLYLSYYADTAAGASIAGSIVVLYVVVLALQSRPRTRPERTPSRPAWSD